MHPTASAVAVAADVAAPGTSTCCGSAADFTIFSIWCSDQPAPAADEKRAAGPPFSHLNLDRKQWTVHGAGMDGININLAV